MSKGHEGAVIPAAFLLAAGMVAAAWIGAGAYRDVRLAGEGLTVKGYAEQGVRSERAVWRGELEARAARLADAQAELAAQTAALALWLTDEGGLRDEEWRWLPLQSWTHYRTAENGVPTAVVEAYQLTRSVVIATDRVDLVRALSARTDELLKQGVLWNAWQPEFYAGDLAEVKLELMARATEDARARALQFAKGGGNELGPLRSARQGVLQVTRPHSVEVGDWGMYDTGSIEKIVKAVVTVTFDLR
jgi:uncharacterized protein